MKSSLLGAPGGFAKLLDAHVDVEGDLLVAGDFSSSLEIGGTTLTSNAEAAGFLAKLAPSGAAVWTKTFETALPSAKASSASGRARW